MPESGSFSPRRRDAVKLAAASAFLTSPASRAYDGTYDEAARMTWRPVDLRSAEPALLQRELVRCATLAPNGHNAQPWKFRLRDNAIDIVPDWNRRTPVVDPDDHHLWASLGCAAENLVEAAAASGRHAEVRTSPTAVEITLTPSGVRRSALFEAIPRRQSTRAPFDARMIPSTELGYLERAVKDPSVQVLLLTDRRQIARVRDYVVAGNSAQMADPAFVAELKSWIRFNRRDAAQSRDGLYAGASGNPALPSWIGSMAFDLLFSASSENKKYIKQIDNSAGIAIFAATTDGPGGWVAAGRACERFLLQATALDIRTAFVNQPVEVVSLRSSFAADFGVPQRRPDLIVRFGYGPRLPPSLRRPVAELLVSGSGASTRTT